MSSNFSTKKMTKTRWLIAIGLMAISVGVYFFTVKLPEQRITNVLIGTWENKTGTIQFFADKSFEEKYALPKNGSYASYYKVQGDLDSFRLELAYFDDPPTALEPLIFDAYIENDTLILESDKNHTYTFTRKK